MSVGDATGIAAAVIVFAAALVAWRHLREARILREAQTRPFVVVDFEIQQTLIYLRITNTGTTIARDVRITFDVPVESAIRAADEPRLDELKIFTSGIPTLPPGKVIATIFDAFPQRLEKGLPDSYNVGLEYVGPDGHKITETTVLDLGIYRNLQYAVRRDAHDIHETIKGIEKLLKKWTAAGQPGLIVVTPEDVRRRETELLEFYESRRADREAVADLGAGTEPDEAAE